MSKLTKLISVAALSTAFLCAPALVSHSGFDFGLAHADSDKAAEMKKKSEANRMEAEKRHEEMQKQAEEHRVKSEKMHNEMKALNDEHQKEVQKLNEDMQKGMRDAKTPEERQKLQMSHSENMQALQKGFEEKRMKLQDTRGQ